MIRTLSPSVVDTGVIAAPRVLDVAGRTDRGQIRERNEDQFLIADLHQSLALRSSSVAFNPERVPTRAARATLMLVADGMGGMGAGDVASDEVVRTVARYAVHCADWAADPQRLDDELADALEICRLRLRRAAERHPETLGMGTTLTLACVLDRTLHVMHVGDSRCYLLRDGALSQITTDHTVAEKLAGDGQITRDSLDYARYRHVLWNTVGSELGCGEGPDLSRTQLRGGDRLLLCSDGLTNHVDDDELERIVSTAPNAAHACDTLIALANTRGGSDNITCVVARLPRRGL